MYHKKNALKAISISILVLFLTTPAFSAPFDGKISQSGESCSKDWHKCETNEEFVTKNYMDWGQIKSNCKEAATRRSRYGDPEFPSWGTAFGHYSNENTIKKGILELYEDDIKYPNKSGGVERSSVKCTYDLNKDEVISIEIY